MDMPRPDRVDAGTQGRLWASLWRALVHCLHPRVIGLSLLPLLVTSLLLGGLAWFGWEPGVAAVREGLDRWSLSAVALSWLDAVGGGGFRAVLAPLVLLMVAVPFVVVISLVLVTWLMTPALVQFVVARRFPGLLSRHVASMWASVGSSLGATSAALGATLLTLPLWFVPPLALVLPPLIWGWLTWRVMVFDVLAAHATPSERRALVHAHRPALWVMGITTGLLGAAPAMIWALGAMAIVFAPLLMLVSVWLYTLVFAFSSLWFAHYLLGALHQLRLVATDVMVPPSPISSGTAPP